MSLRLKECVELITKGTTPTSIGGGFTSSGINFLKVEGISETGQFITEKFQYIDENTHNKLLKRSQIQELDILFSIAGTIGRTAIATKDILPCNTNQAVAILRPLKEKVDPYFLLYCLKDKKRLNKAISNVVQSVQSNLSLSEIGNIEIPEYSLETQKKISEILLSLDNKIILNLDKKNNLEEIVRTLFKSWFIDFDPLVEKLENKNNKFTNEIKELFPDCFEKSEIGEIPKGWHLTSLGEILTFIGSGKRPKGGSSISERQVPSIGAENINFLGNYNYFKEKYIPKEFYLKLKEKNLSIKDYDILIYKDGAKIGRSTIFGKGFPHDECTINEHVHLIRCDQIIQKYLYFYISTKKKQEELISLNTASAQPGINQTQLKTLKILQPDKKILKKFDEFVSPILDLIFYECLENNYLLEIKNLLLPKLISGQLKLNTIDNIFEKKIN